MMMKISRSNRRRRTTVAQMVEPLEQRQLLSATLLSAIPTQSINAGQSTQVMLATYLNDPSITGGTVVEMHTPLGIIPLQLTDQQTPLTVANFVRYITNGDFTPTIIQRSVPGFVLQGGGTKPDGSNNASVASLVGEPGISNTAGTIAMALSSGPNSGTNQWFINLADNSSALDGTSPDNGPFTVFGRVIDGGMTVANAIAQLQIINGSAENSNWYFGPGDGLPVINYSGSSTPTTVPQANLVTDNIVKLTAAQAGPTYTVVSSNPDITATIANGVLTLTAAAGAASSSTTVTATVTDLAGGTAASTFHVNVTAVVAPVLPSVTITDGSGTQGTNTQILFPVALSAASTTPITLNYALTAGSAPAGDFQATGTALTIPAGVTTANIPVTLVADTTGADETFAITLSSLSANAVFPAGTSTETATGMIHPVVKIPTTTTVTALSPALPAGGTDTFTASVQPAVSGTAATGSVTFNSGGVSIGTAALVNGTATLTTTLVTPGNESVSAVYAGSSTYASSASNAVTVNVSTLTASSIKSTLPVQLIIGTAAHGGLLVTTTNDTAARMTGSAVIKVYASLNGLIDANSVLIGMTKRKLNLPAGHSVTTSLQIKSLPASLVVGNYKLLAQTIDPSLNTSDSAAGPTLAVVTPVVSLAEQFVSLALPAAVVAGSKTPLVARLRITNQGNVTSTGTTTITLLASTDGTVANGTAFKTITPKLSIRPGKSAVVTIPLGAFPNVAAGDYFITASVTDSRGGASSADLSSPVNIGPAKIDLANSLVSLPATGKVGKSVSVQINLTNLGNISAVGKLQISFAASTSPTGSSPIALATLSTRINIKSNRTQALHLRVPLPSNTPTGQLYFVSVVDPANLFADTDLSNNTSVSPSFITVS